MLLLGIETFVQKKMESKPLIKEKICIVDRVQARLFLPSNHENTIVVNCSMKGQDVDDYHLKMLDSRDFDINSSVYKFLDIVNKECTKNVLVYCDYGISRSPAVVIGYLIVKHKMSFPEAFYLVRSKKSDISPNQGFQNQLKRLAKKNE
jgi:protein-tyrosine phosphatase